MKWVLKAWRRWRLHVLNLKVQEAWDASNTFRNCRKFHKAIWWNLEAQKLEKARDQYAAFCALSEGR